MKIWHNTWLRLKLFSYLQTNSNLNDFLLSDESFRIWYLQRLEEWANLLSEDGSRGTWISRENMAQGGQASDRESW